MYVIVIRPAHYSPYNQRFIKLLYKISKQPKYNRMDQGQSLEKLLSRSSQTKEEQIIFGESIIDNIAKKMTDEEKKKALIQFLGFGIQQEGKNQFQDEQFTCPICRQYFVKAVTVKCGHSFCEFCIQEYFLFSKQCPVCEVQIRSKPFASNNVINEFIESFISQHHSDYLNYFKEKNEKYKQWKQQKKLTTLKGGMQIDVRDQNYVWCKGIVMRVISRIGDPIKFLKVQYKSQNGAVKEQQIKSNQERLAPGGFYTNRKQLPQYKKLMIDSQNK